LNSSKNVRGIGSAFAGSVLRRSPEWIAGRLRTGKRLAGRTRGAVRSGVNRVATIDTHANPDTQRVIGAPNEKQVRRASGTVFVLVGLLLLGFVVQVVGVSQLRHSRDQSLLYDAFRYELADATAPVAQVDGEGDLYPMGTALAVLTIPEIGVNEVILEGTSSRTMLSGPGHRRDTALPGQAGSSVIMGRQAAYGGPFGSLASLKKGDRISTVTGQGEATYTVDAVRFAGDPQPLAPDAGTGRLTLVSASGPAFLADGVVRVDATLTSKPFATPIPALLVGSLTSAESPLASDESGWLPLLLFLELAAVAIFAFTIAVRRWGSWHTWVVATPVALVLGCTIAEQVIVLLPNLY